MDRKKTQRGMNQKMKFKDLTFNDKNLFTYLEEIQAFPFPKEVVTSSEIFHAFIFLNGERELFNKIEDSFIVDPETTLTQLAMNVKLMNGKKWELLYNLMELDFSSTSIETVTENVKNDGKNTNNVSSFDSSEMVEDTNENKTNTLNRNYERSTKSVQQFVKNITMLQDRLIYDTIFEDIRTTVLKNII